MPDRVIVVVEDDADVALLLRWTVEKGGTPIMCRNFEQAKALDGWADYQVCLTDYGLGPGGNGVDLVEWLARAHPHVKSVVVTANAYNARVDADARGLVDVPVLSKPFTWDDIHAALG